MDFRLLFSGPELRLRPDEQGSTCRPHSCHWCHRNILGAVLAQGYGPETGSPTEEALASKLQEASTRSSRPATRCTCPGQHGGYQYCEGVHYKNAFSEHDHDHDHYHHKHTFSFKAEEETRQKLAFTNPHLVFVPPLPYVTQCCAVSLQSPFVSSLCMFPAPG